MPKKAFIDRKKAVSFHLVHRSQQDPLSANETAPQRVLLPAPSKKSKKQVEDEHKFGIFYDDDYDYLQHLREVDRTVEWVPTENRNSHKKENDATEEPRINLPSSVFASAVEEDVGLLNKAAPQGLRLDLDPDIVAAMDGDFSYDDPDNELEDNFMELANAEGDASDYEGDSEYEEESDGESQDDISSNFEDEALDEVASLNGQQFSFRDEETRSHFTNYSMSSSVMRRNDQLSLLDDRFEKAYAAYDENEIGALDCDDIEGHIIENSDILLQYAAEFEKQKAREKLDQENMKMRLRNLESDSSDEEMVDMEVKPKEKWDCESILSTYSNIYNHPKLISEPKSNKIKINSRTGMPEIPSNKLTAKSLALLNQETNHPSRGTCKLDAAQSVSNLSALSIRPKGESPDKRRERKKQLKEYRRERRLERKANIEAFKEETKRQIKIEMNNKNNVQGNRIL